MTGVGKRIGVDAYSGVILPEHIEREKKDEFLMKKVGSTGSGVGAATVDRTLRMLKLAKEFDELKPYTTNVYEEVQGAIDKDEDLIVEGTQGLYLSLYHGTYPFVTSRDVSASGVCSEVGIGPKSVKDVIIVFKSYVTRVGGGPLDGELSEEEAQKRGWMEIATVTGRKRRAAPFNFDLAKKAVKMNSATQIALTKLDTVFPECKGLTSDKKLSPAAREFIDEIESKLQVPVTIIGTGPRTQDIIDSRAELLEF
jgi:adenylosuccinate synthase